MKKLLITILTIITLVNNVYGERIENELLKLRNPSNEYSGSFIGNPIAGQYLAANRTNATAVNIMVAQAATNFPVPLAYIESEIDRAGMFCVLTNTFSRTLTVTFYSNNDYKGSNAYWRADMLMVVTPITNVVAAGTNRVLVADATGISTNDMIWFSTSNEFARVATVVGNTITLENNVLYGHALPQSIARVAEFGDIHVIDNSRTSNLWMRISATNAFTQAIYSGINYRR